MAADVVAALVPVVMMGTRVSRGRDRQRCECRQDDEPHEFSLYHLLRGPGELGCAAYPQRHPEEKGPFSFSGVAAGSSLAT